MKTTYLVWKTPACGGINPSWQELTGSEFLALVRSPKAKGRYFVQLAGMDSGNITVIEASRENYLEWKRDQNHCAYLRSCARGITTVSYHTLGLGDTCNGEELLEDESTTVEADCIAAVEHKMLNAALQSLTDDEYRLVAYLYLSDRQSTERGYAGLIGLPNVTVHRMKIATLEKIRRFFEKSVKQNPKNSAIE